MNTTAGRIAATVAGFAPVDASSHHSGTMLVS
jgi:hypothetical protein